MSASSRHSVVLDAAGFGGHERLTCLGRDCQEATLVRQGYMRQDTWDRLKSDFLLLHRSEPSSVEDDFRDALQTLLRRAAAKDGIPQLHIAKIAEDVFRRYGYQARIFPG